MLDETWINVYCKLYCRHVIAEHIHATIRFQTLLFVSERTLGVIQMLNTLPRNVFLGSSKAFLGTPSPLNKKENIAVCLQKSFNSTNFKLPRHKVSEVVNMLKG